ncbi:MAG: VanZ family protein [Casimicrobiaceae bacterium]|nr:VanZ family protein [Casimicrobiaceae bacterium]MCX8097589.1 VanZ family protein [Casimicrobiaceae bacterium]MDW8312093.1 VanZ family protein [Burkholderiales bacterium]
MKGTSSLAAWATAVCVAVIVYASLQPFSGWDWTAFGRSSWLGLEWAWRVQRGDLWLNLAGYVPLGILLSASLAARTSPQRALILTVAAGVALSLTLELLQTALPPRVASVHDVVFNALGTLAGASLGPLLRRVFRPLARLREAWIVPSAAGDLQLVLLGTWLLAQVNPAIPVFGLAFHPGSTAAYETPVILIEAIQTGCALVGIGLFADLMMRRRVLGGAALVVILGLAVLLKTLAAESLLKTQALEAWLRPGHSIGLALGALLLTMLFWLPRPLKSIVAGIALLTSVLVLALLPDLLLAEAPLSVFALRFAHLAHLNGLTQAIVLVWPIAATAVLFWRFGTEAKAKAPSSGHAAERS